MESEAQTTISWLGCTQNTPDATSAVPVRLVQSPECIFCMRSMAAWTSRANSGDFAATSATFLPNSSGGSFTPPLTRMNSSSATFTLFPDFMRPESIFDRCPWLTRIKPARSSWLMPSRLMISFTCAILSRNSALLHAVKGCIKMHKYMHFKRKICKPYVRWTVTA